jgi:aminopeptidase N
MIQTYVCCFSLQQLTSEGMVLLASAMPEKQFELTSTVEVMPESNTQLSGLYKSGAVFCTQCEAEGFRRITYFQDRYVPVDSNIAYSRQFD